MSETAEIGQGSIREITVNIKKLISGTNRTKKASIAIKRMKKLVTRQQTVKWPVYISEDVNRKLFSCGNRHDIGRIRIRIEKSTSNNDSSKPCFKISLVDVKSFKNLKDTTITEASE